MPNFIKSHPQLLPGALSDLFAHVSVTGELTLADRYGLMAALLEEPLLTEERASIDRLLRATRAGRAQVVDKLSAVADADE
ncbi:hypothetical protein VB712_01360 [Spirulina sp. CCNP1310]|uniref:hypothetical protein n=1 Tax=Spirulina sp. CCNP1310 TaxID=3110249 RepID=UPI002B204C74|nr:hypothetical protein [Spirulina sp. CCNP1310]MEA5417851.1 hypothetical protein [Spirulina sp. CCNP1310]